MFVMCSMYAVLCYGDYYRPYESNFLSARTYLSLGRTWLSIQCGLASERATIYPLPGYSSIQPRLFSIDEDGRRGP